MKVKKNIQSYKKLLGTRLKKVREMAGQSQEAFAENMNVTPATVNRYEKGHRSPDADFLCRVATKFGCDPAWLLTGQRSDKKRSCQSTEPEPGEEAVEIMNQLTENPNAQKNLIRLIRAGLEMEVAVASLRKLATTELETSK